MYKKYLTAFGMRVAIKAVLLMVAVRRHSPRRKSAPLKATSDGMRAGQSEGLMVEGISQIDLISDDHQDREQVIAVAARRQLSVRIFSSLASYDVTSSQCRSWVISKATLSDGTGVDLLRKLRSKSLDVPVIFLRDDEPLSDLAGIMKFGFHHVLQRPVTAKDLEMLMCHNAAEIESNNILVQSTLDAHNKLARLDVSEIQILEAATLGLPNKTTAMRLGIALRTLERRRYVLMKKLEVTSTEELVALAIRRQYASWIMPQSATSPKSEPEELSVLRMA